MQSRSLPIELDTVDDKTRSAAGSHAVVILRENEVGGDLAGAIARVRAHQDTARSQILIIAADDGAEAAPNAEERRAPPVPPATLAPPHHAQASAWGRGLTHLVDDLEQFLHEVQREVAALAEDIGEGTRARLQHHARVLSDIVTWARAVTTDMRALAGAASAGRSFVDVGELVAAAVARYDGALDAVRLAIEPSGDGSGSAPVVEVDAEAARQLIRLSLELMAGRVGVGGAIALRVDGAREASWVSLWGKGAARPEVDRARAEQFGDLATRLGVGITVDPEAPPGCSSLRLRFSASVP